MHGIVSTIGQKCKRCYSCIRECPAKAIRVVDGKAVIVPERCISCGHCVKVCSQGAKKIISDVEFTLNSILPSGDAVAIVAPSFAASFPDTFEKLPAALRKLGFDKVCETAFGADLIAGEYKKCLESNNSGKIISSPCPAVNNFIEKYYSNLVPNLAKIVSPMIAMGRYLKEKLGKDTRVVFIGPCVAKKSEYKDKEVDDAIDAVLTFTELKKILHEQNVVLAEMEDTKFDPPYANSGKSFPLAGGLIKTSEIPTDILEKDIIVVEGMKNVEEIIKDLSEDKINARFIDILFCEGCINGPAISSNLNYYSRREKVIEYIEKSLHDVDKIVWRGELYNSRNIDYTREFTANSERIPEPDEETIKAILAKTDKFSPKDELNCGACGYRTCREYAIAIAKDLAEEDMCLPYLVDKLERAYQELQDAEDQLKHAEKLASIGQLAAGVAHEINNPLGTIMLYSSMLKRDIENKRVSETNSEDLTTIIDEANRCKNIVANLLNFARQGKIKITRVDIAGLLESIIKTVKIHPQYKDIVIGLTNHLDGYRIEGDPEQLKQVLVNLVNNACEAMDETKTKNLEIALTQDTNNVFVDIRDTGCGIHEDNIKKLYTPFFTTKKMGKGTGLGLAISYGIIKMHRGDIQVESKINEGTKFTVRFPKSLSITNTNMN